MQKSSQAVPAVVLLIVGIVVSLGVAVLIFYVPRLAVVWADSAEHLPAWKIVLLETSDVCVQNGLLVFPVLLAWVGGCIVWIVASLRKGKAVSAGV